MRIEAAIGASAALAAQYVILLYILGSKGPRDSFKVAASRSLSAIFASLTSLILTEYLVTDTPKFYSWANPHFSSAVASLSLCLLLYLGPIAYHLCTTRSPNFESDEPLFIVCRNLIIVL